MKAVILKFVGTDEEMQKLNEEIGKLWEYDTSINNFYLFAWETLPATGEEEAYKEDGNFLL